MLRATNLLASVVVAGLMAPASSYASWPMAKALHLHPDEGSKDSRITVNFFNESAMFQDIEVAGHTYTVMPHHAVSVTAPAGTQVIAGTSTPGHRRGDLLVTIAPFMKGQTLSMN